MSDNKEIVIQDTCILFDLVDLGLLRHFFQLDFIVYTTAQVVEEIKTGIHKQEIGKYIESNELNIDSEGGFEAIYAIFDTYSALSYTDSSVLELAMRKDAIIFSSDGSLRKISKRERIIVRGTLWIIERLYLCEEITKETALRKLNDYLAVNTRAPKKEIENLILKINGM